MSYMREKVHNTHIGQKVALTDSEACSVPEENPEGKEQKDEAAMIRNKKKHDRIEKEISDWQGMLTKKYAGK